MLARREMGRIQRATREWAGLSLSDSVRTTVELNRIFDGALASFAHAMAERSIQLDLEMRGHFAVQAAPEEMHQVFAAMIACLLQGAQRGAIIRARMSASSNGVRLTLADAHQRIDHDQLMQWLDPSYTKRDWRNLDVGLWQARELVEKADGRLSLRGGNGLCISLLLPRRPA